MGLRHVGREAQSDLPRAVVGLTDILARAYLRQQLGERLMTFAVSMNNVCGNRSQCGRLVSGTAGWEEIEGGEARGL